MAQSDSQRGQESFDVERDELGDTPNAIAVALDDEELAAVEGWRAANLIASLPDAVRELVRLGLLSEIAKVQKLVEDIRASVTNHSRQKRPDTPI